MTSFNTISREQLVDMFSDMETKYRWNVSQDLVWGYFFTAADMDSLDPLRSALVESGYRFVGYLDRESPTLHMERIETHSVDSLDRRNEELASLAAELRAVYDGMDVGPVRKG